MAASILSKTDLSEIVLESNTYAQVIVALGWGKPSTTKYNRVLDLIMSHKIEYNHLTKRSIYDKETLVVAAQKSKSIRELVRNLGVQESLVETRAATIVFDIRRWRIDISHFNGRKHLRITGDRCARKKTPIELIFQNRAKIKCTHFKKRLFREGYKKKICEKCNRTEHNGAQFR